METTEREIIEDNEGTRAATSECATEEGAAQPATEGSASISEAEGGTGAGEAEGPEVGAELEPAAGEAPLVTAVYETDQALLEHYTRLLVGKKQAAFGTLMAVFDFAIAVFVVTTEPDLWIVSVVLAALGVGMLVWRSRAASMHAQRILRDLDRAELHRTVEVFGDRVVLTKANGTAHTYPAGELTGLRYDDGLAVLVFGRLGLTVPRSGITAGTWDDLLSWVGEHLPQQPA